MRHDVSPCLLQSRSITASLPERAVRSRHDIETDTSCAGARFVTARELAAEFWRLFDAGRFRDALPLLTEDFEAHWPNTRERIRGRENFIALNENYPGVSRCKVQRIEECAGGVVTVTEIETETGDDRVAFFAVSFFSVQEGHIVAAEEYFAENGPPPFDRSAWAERY